MKRRHVLELALLERHRIFGGSGLALDVAILSTTCAEETRSVTIAGTVSDALVVSLDTVIPADTGLLLEGFAPLLVAEARLVVDEAESVGLQGFFPGGGLGVRGRRVVGFDVPD